MRILSLGQEDPLEEGMATYSIILAWRIPWTGRVGDKHILNIGQYFVTILTVMKAKEKPS